MGPLSEDQRSYSAVTCESLTPGGLHPPPQGQISRSSLSTIECGESQPSPKSMTKRWTTLEAAGRCMFILSVAFFIGGLLMTIVGFTNLEVLEQARLPLQIIGPVCLATTAVMWLLGAVFSRLWKMEWKSRQQALELRARVQLHAMAMDILNEPVLSPRIMQDPKLRRQLLTRLRQQSAMDSGSFDAASRRSSRLTALDSKRHSVIGSLLRQDHERRQSRDPVALLPPFELPGIQISRIETVDYEDAPPGSSTGVSGGVNAGGKRYIIFHSDLSSEFSQLSFTSEDFLPGSRSSRSRSSRASSNISSRLWDFSPRESEWDADVSLGSRDSQLSRHDWGGGPSYGMDTELSLLSPCMPRRKGSIVTFDVSEPARRHSSPAPMNARRRGSVAEGGQRGEAPPSALRNAPACGARYVEDYRTLTQYRKRSAGDQSIISVPIDENDGDEEEEEGGERSGDHAAVHAGATASEARLGGLIMRRDSQGAGGAETAAAAVGGAHDAGAAAGDGVTGIVILAVRRASRPDTDVDSEVEARVERILRDIEYSTTDSVDETRLISPLGSAAGVGDAPERPQGLVTDTDVESPWQADAKPLDALTLPSLTPVSRKTTGLLQGFRDTLGRKTQGVGQAGVERNISGLRTLGRTATGERKLVPEKSAEMELVSKSTTSETSRTVVSQASRESGQGADPVKSTRFKWMTYLPGVLSTVAAGRVGRNEAILSPAPRGVVKPRQHNA